MIEAEKAYSVMRMCELLEVSRSGYKWRKSRDSGPTPVQRRRAELDARVAEFHAASDGVYGAPRILADLRADGARVSAENGGGLAAPPAPGRDLPAPVRVGHHGGGFACCTAERPGGALFRHRDAQPGVDL